MELIILLFILVIFLILFSILFFMPSRSEIHTELSQAVNVVSFPPRWSVPKWSVEEDLMSKTYNLEEMRITLLVRRPFVCLSAEIGNESLVNESSIKSLLLLNPPCYGNYSHLPEECVKRCIPGLFLSVEGNRTTWELLLGNFTDRILIINDGKERITIESIRTQSGEEIWGQVEEVPA
ncbi:hypothetical protein D6D85_08375 [Candidatus Methanodesulfokora washburnensis]|uniref:Uncharacterized protein n=2 Tax=Candidatus Methanodesulfokora washburnensis TaxID=2478471 RepID=A0A429GKE8_9CREN|nr:hypothetical protein D6D85_08375 [Candidatus Methanodesulfokores washburnensis]